MKVKLDRDWYVTPAGSVVVIQMEPGQGVITLVEGKQLYDEWEVQKFKMIGDPDRFEHENVEEAYKRVCNEILKYGNEVK